jgi:hypothetical protein
MRKVEGGAMWEVEGGPIGGGENRKIRLEPKLTGAIYVKNSKKTF